MFWMWEEGMHPGEVHVVTERLQLPNSIHTPSHVRIELDCWSCEEAALPVVASCCPDITSYFDDILLIQLKAFLFLSVFLPCFHIFLYLLNAHLDKTLALSLTNYVIQPSLTILQQANPLFSPILLKGFISDHSYTKLICVPLENEGNDQNDTAELTITRPHLVSFTFYCTLVLAKRSIFSVGSEPMERKHTKGIRLSPSAHIASISRITPSAYFGPSDSAI